MKKYTKYVNLVIPTNSLFGNKKFNISHTSTTFPSFIKRTIKKNRTTKYAKINKPN